MVGDLVTFKDCVDSGDIIPIRIESLHSFDDCFLGTIGNEKSCDSLEFDDEIVGIPITAEIIQRNFEKKTHYGIFDDYFDFEIREYSESIYIVNYHSCEFSLPTTQIVGISFVHELQHALRLCGIEKEIVL